MEDISIHGLTFTWQHGRWRAMRRFPQLPLEAYAPPVGLAKENEPPPNFDVLLTSAGQSPEALIQALTESGICSRSQIEAAIDDRPRFVARNLPEREAQRLLLRIMRAGGWSELHPHEPGDGVRPTFMDEAMIVHTRQLADMIAQQNALRQAAGFNFPDESQFEELQGSVERMSLEQREDDASRAAGMSPVFIETHGEQVPPSAEQTQALARFLEIESEVCAKSLDAILRHYRQRREDEPNWFDGDDPVETAADLWPLLSFEGLTVRRDAADGLALLGLTFSPDWEDEHGLGVCLHDRTVLDVGHADVAENGPFVGFGWSNAGATEQEREYLARIAPQIGTDWESPGSPLRSHLEVLKAMASGDQEALLRLAATGGSMDQLPAAWGFIVPQPVFAAIESQSPKLVGKLLADGADARAAVHYQGKWQTPLQFAREQLAGYLHARSLQERELAGLEQEQQSPGSGAASGTLFGGIRALRAMAAQLIGGQKSPQFMTDQPTDALAVHRQRYEQLVLESRQAEQQLEQIVRMLQEHTAEHGDPAVP